MSPLGALPEMPEIYFSFGLTRDLEQIKLDLKGQKQQQKEWHFLCLSILK